MVTQQHSAFSFFADSILKLFNASRQSQLSAHESKLYNSIAFLCKTARLQRKKKVFVRQRLEKIRELEKNNFVEIIDEMSSTMQFLISNINNFQKNKYNRRFSLEDKAFALSLCKKSLKLYKTLVNIFCLSSTETLRKLLKDIDTCGISQCLFDNLEDRVANFKDHREKYCVLLFDEMKLKANFYYHKSLDSGIDRYRIL